MRDYTPFSRGSALKWLNSYSNTLPAYVAPTIRLEGILTRLRGLAVRNVELHNRSGSTVVAGLGVRIPISEWVAGQWTNGTTTFTDDTTDAQDAGTSDFPLDTLNTNNNGFCVGCRVLFNALSVLVGAATEGTGPAWADAIRYSQDDGAGGVAWAAISAANMFVAPSFTATGEQLVAWNLPADFVVATDPAGLGTGFPPGYAWINVRATTAPTSTAGLASLLVVGRAYGLTEGVTDNSVVSLFTNSEMPLEGVGDALAPIFSVAAAGNQVEGLVRVRG